MKTLPRKITPIIKDALKVSPIVFLNGARQSGKSTLVLEWRFVYYPCDFKYDINACVYCQLGGT